MSDQDTSLPGGAVDKALSVLEALVTSAPGASLGTISQSAGLLKPTTHAILQVLVERGYARNEGAGTYGVGPQALSLAGQVLENVDWARYARPFLLQLQERVPETVHFAVLFGTDLVYVDKLEARGAYRMRSRIGMHLPLHSTAIGKAVLAELPDERDVLLNANELSPRTSRTIVDRAALDEGLAEIARLGVAVDNEENEEEVRCVGAPVFGPLGRVIGGISVSAPAFRLPDIRMREVELAVIEAACEVSGALGTPPPVFDMCRRRVEWLLAGPDQTRLLLRHSYRGYP